MNCKYCGAGLPTNSGVCQNCGRLIPMDQLKKMREMTDPSLTKYRNKDTAFYKSSSAYEGNNSKKGLVILIGIIIAIVLFIFIVTR